MKKFILSTVICYLIGSVVIAQTWVPFTKSTPTEPIVNLQQSNTQQVVFTIEVCGMYSSNISEEGESFQRLLIPDAGRSMQTGEPELPYIRQMIAIPECDDISLTISINGQQNFNNYNVYPAPDYEEVEYADGSTSVQEVFIKNATVYAQNISQPGMNAEIVSTGYLRDQKYAEVYFYPIQFNPVTQQLLVNTNYTATLSFTNPQSDVNLNTGIFNNVATNTMLNYESSGITAKVNDNMQGNGNVQWIDLTDTAQAYTIVADYLIICSDPFFEPNNPNSEVLRIANHRATYNGFDVAILNANTIFTILDFEYSDPFFIREQKIRTCVRRIYEGANAQHTYDGKLAYVLLIGDVENGNFGMPTSYEWYVDPEGDEVASDYYFSCTTRENDIYDRIGDLYIGRFCVNNNLGTGLTELHNIVEKTIYYETEYSFENWRKNLLHIYGIANLQDPTDEIEFYEYHENTVRGWIPDSDTLHIINSHEDGLYTPEMVIDSINRGCYYVSYIGHGGDSSWTQRSGENTYVTKAYFMENLSNEYVTPFVGAFACETAWFDQNPGNDCLGEALTTYSEDKGFVAYFGGSRSYWTSGELLIRNLRLNIPLAIFKNLSHITGEFILEAKLGNLYSGNAKGIFNLLGDPALNIMAQGYEITHYTHLTTNTVISSEVTVKSGSTLKLWDNNELFFEGNGKLIIEDGAYLRLNNNTIIHGNNNSQQIKLKGSIVLQSEVLFTSPLNNRWTGLVLDNPNHDIIIYGASFERCNISGGSMTNQLTISNCSFTNKGEVDYIGKRIKIQNSTFDSNSGIILGSGNKSSYAELDDCSFQNHGDNPIFINGFSSFKVVNCTISNNSGTGIRLHYSGGEPGAEKLISDNIINNNGNAGIEFYNSDAEILTNNIISNNTYGITSLNSSNISIIGNPSAQYVSETQQLVDNTINQLYTTYNSFPFEFTWNAIIKEINLTPLIKYVPGLNPTPFTLNVENNYWGENFIPADDLDPYSIFDFEPVWNLTGGTNADDVKALFDEAQDKIVQEDFIGAKTDFQQLIFDYPDSRYALASLHELFNVEELAGNDYIALKEYYATVESSNNNPNLLKLAVFLANYCNIQLENYEEAIAWFENVILYPETIEDSVFAIIDLGYTYFLMENGTNRSIVTGMLVEHIPENMEAFSTKRDTLLALLFKNTYTSKSPEIFTTEKKHGKLNQNIPNPTSGSTTISFYLEKPSSVTLNLFDYSGKKVISIKKETTIIGTNSIIIDSGKLSPGIYIYSLSINGLITDTKKMTVLGN